MRRPLKYQLLVPFLAVTLATVVALSAVGALLASSRVRNDLRRSLRNIAQTLVEANFPIEDSVLRQAQGLSGATFAAVDQQGELRAASDRELLTQTRSVSEEAVPLVSASNLELSQTVRLHDESYFHAVVELDRRPIGGRLELLHIYYPERELSEARWQAVWPPLLVGLVVSLLLLAVTTILASRVTRPIEQLGRHAEDIAHGTFEPIAVPERDDEIRDLVVSINRMTAMLAKYEEEVRRNERLRTLGQLGGGIAHQIRNAVTGCRMALDLHAGECNLRGDGETIDVATRQLELIERYLQRFLTLDRPAKSKAELVDLGDLAAHALPLVAPAAHHVGVKIEIESPASPMKLRVDPHVIEQILVNLVLNAIEATSNEVPERQRVCIRLSTKNGEARIDVLDRGPGVSPQVQAKLFEPFTTDKPDGVGLGLTTARDLARSQGGEIELREEAGQTCFRLRLPRSV